MYTNSLYLLHMLLAVCTINILSLYTQNLYTSFTVKAKNGKELLAIEVISKLLIYFKNEFFTEYTLLQQKPNMNLPSISRIMWIITVPAIWSLAAKQIMKSAATMVRV